MYEGRGRKRVQELRAGHMDGAVSAYRGVMSEIVDVGEPERSECGSFQRVEAEVR